MEPNEKPKFEWQRMLITTGIVLLAALVVGGATWYVMDKSAKEIKTANDQSVAALQKQIDDLNKTETVAETSGTKSPDIRSIDFATVIPKVSSLGSWRPTLYADLNGDGKEEAVPSFRVDGTGGILAVYIYGYVNGQLKQLYKNEGLDKANISIVKVANKDYLKLDWANLTSATNSGKPNSDLVQDMHQYVVWTSEGFLEQESI